MANRKKPTASEKIRKLQQELARAKTENEALRRHRIELIEEQGAKRQRIADLQDQAAHIEHEAAVNIEEIREELADAKYDAAYNRGLASGRVETVDLLARLVSNAAANLKPLTGPNLSEILEPMVPNIDNAIRGITNVVHAIMINRASGDGKSPKQGKGPDGAEDPDGQVGD